MSFSSFSKQFTANMYTTVENQFITKYLPQADGDAVRVYLYGLYLCNCKEEFDADACAKLLKLSKEKLLEIFSFWEECDLVHVLSREPLYVEYQPVSASVGKPKPIRPEKYAQFNRELYKLLQRAGKDFKPYEMQRILEFLENSPFEPQAFLLVAEYCVKKDGEKVTAAHMLNKAKKLCEDYQYTYEQVERNFADFNNHERELSKLFSLLGIYRKPQDGDYRYLSKWAECGMEFPAVVACANALKKGTLSTLDSLVTELSDQAITSAAQAKEYLLRREQLTNVVYLVARKLGIKIQNPRSYIEEYAEPWLERGYDAQSLTRVSSLGFKLRFGFEELNALLDDLYRSGIIDEKSVDAYCSTREKQLKLLQSIQSVCGIVKKTPTALDMIATWKSWNFSDGMILEAAKRSANASAPLPYMNKLLSEWKNKGIYEAKNIPDVTVARTEKTKPDYRSEAAIAADERSEREHYYSVLRQKALERAENNKKIAQSDAQFKQADALVKRGEIELARAEVFEPEQAPSLREQLHAAIRARQEALARLCLSEEDFIPKYACTQCSDSGFLPDGRACNCYKPEQNGV